jgi:hypothetical protein
LAVGGVDAHDHIFVPYDRADEAMHALTALASRKPGDDLGPSQSRT